VDRLKKTQETGQKLNYIGPNCVTMQKKWVIQAEISQWTQMYTVLRVQWAKRRNSLST